MPCHLAAPSGQPTNICRSTRRSRLCPVRAVSNTDGCDLESSVEASRLVQRWSRRDLLAGALTASSVAMHEGPSTAAAAPAEVIAPLQPSTSLAPASVPAIQTAAPNCASTGITAFRDPWINRGLALDTSARDTLSLQGLLPGSFTDLDTEITRARAALDRATTPLSKYQVLMTLKEQDAHCFYTMLQENIEEFLPLLYTPTVGDACLSWGTLMPRPPGLYITHMLHKGRVGQVVETWPEQQVRIAVITDGERILGLGDLGAHGMGIPVGKSVVYGGCGVDPRCVLPITVDVGCGTEDVRDDPLYVGTRQPRVPDAEYYSFMDEVVQAVQARYDGSVLIHWEDVSSRHSFTLLDRLRAAGVATFNDDIECTAAVTLAALLGAQRVPGVLPLAEQRVLFFGAGQASLGCAALLVAALHGEGLTEGQARQRVWLMDSKGLLLSSRTDLSPSKKAWAQDPKALKLPPGSPPPSGLLATVRAVQPTALIGAASQGGAFTQPVVEAMVTAAEGAARAVGAAGKARPIVFALSNPTKKAECTFADAYAWSNGRVVFASGTTFPTLQIDALSGRVLPSSGPSPGQSVAVRVPSQCNNCSVFPGIGLGCLVAGAADVTQGMLLAAARAVAGCVSQSELEATEGVLPPTNRLREVAQAVASEVAAAASVDMVATNRRQGGVKDCGKALAGVGQGYLKQAGGMGSQETGVSDKALSACLDGLLFNARTDGVNNA